MHLLAWNSEDVRRGEDDADISLVSEIVIDFVDFHPNMIENSTDAVTQRADSPAEDSSAVHLEIVQPLTQGFGIWGDSAAASWTNEQLGASPVGAQLVAGYAKIGVGRTENDSPRAVAKEGIGFWICWV